MIRLRNDQHTFELTNNQSSQVILLYNFQRKEKKWSVILNNKSTTYLNNNPEIRACSRSVNSHTSERQHSYSFHN